MVTSAIFLNDGIWEMHLWHKSENCRRNLLGHRGIAKPADVGQTENSTESKPTDEITVSDFPGELFSKPPKDS